MMDTMAAILTLIALAILSSATWVVQCQNLTVPGKSTCNGVFNVSNPLNNINTIDLSLRATRQGKNYSAEAPEGYDTVSG
jgi:hypothetical protein